MSSAARGRARIRRGTPFRRPASRRFELTQYAWSFEGSLGGIAGATVTVLRVDDNTPMPVTMQALTSGYAQDATSWYPNGWTAEAGKTYRVTVSGVTGGPIVYDVEPVTCN